MDVGAIRTAIKTTLSPLQVQVYDFVPDAPNVPAIIVYPRRFEYGSTFGPLGGFDIEFTLLCVSKATNIEGAQETLDGWISDSSPTSVSALIDADTRLGGAVSSAQIVRMESYRAVSFSDAQVRYLAAELILGVLT